MSEKARWEKSYEKSGFGIPSCSICGGSALIPDSEDDCDYAMTIYCPHCGARMANGRLELTDNQIIIMSELYKIGFRYAAKCNFPSIYIFKSLPIKQDDAWATKEGGQEIPSDLFPQMLWEDDKPIFLPDYIDVEAEQ